MDTDHLINAHAMMRRRGHGGEHPEVLGMGVEIIKRKLGIR
jgi:hypothetical protein